ncbi:MAG: glycosyltransferase family 4 protein, partial [Castellaniella sp.]|nr:glycosyltransferase family 4 protein [Castellaniella sp.]
GLLPTTVPAPSVITFYDFAALAYPELYDPRERSYYDTIIPRSAQRASAVIAISERTKADAVRAFGLDEDKVVVTPLGVDPQFRPVPDAAQLVRDRYGVGPGYILGCVGSGHPRKNLKAVVSAFELMPGAGVDLVIVGSVQRDQEACALIEASPRRERIHALGYVPETDLPAIYSAAGALCFPSLFEGFGLPVLEAMACGVPVVCSNASTLPEVAGSAAALHEPKDVDQLLALLQTGLEDEHWRTQAQAAGLEQAARFSWARCTERTLQAYEAARHV